MMKKLAGFTLAEVLITLGIIGVVAAMTIPTLMSNTNKSEFKTAYKKVISAVNQAVTLSVAIDYLDFGDANTGDQSVEDSILGILSKKMQIARVVTQSSNGGANGADDVYRMLERNSSGSSPGSNYTVFFADGMVLSYPKTANKCTNYKNAAELTARGCAAVIDVNGTKNPNRLSHCQWDAGAGTTSAVTMDNTAKSNLCTEADAYISDQYSVKFRGQQLIPNGYAARFVLYEK